MITGQYPHNHGIVWDDADNLVDPESTLPVWLEDAGYRTGLIGKYLNGWDRPEPAPGWTRWLGLTTEPTYYRTEVSVDGDWQRIPRGEYLTDWLTDKASDFISESAAEKSPFFLWLSHYAPHSRRGPVKACENAAVPAPGDLRPFRDAPVPHPASFNEDDVSDKPPLIQDLPRLGPEAKARIARSYRCSLGALQGVDRSVGAVVKALRETGELEDTLVVFTSDNGVFFGEHRLEHGKVEPYEGAAQVPLVMRAGSDVVPSPQPAEASAPVAQIDVAPTILDLAGLRPCDAAGDCRLIDGRSLVDDLNGHETHHGRGILLELRPPGACGYAAIRTSRWTFVERQLPGTAGAACRKTFRELYDRRADPDQLRNAADRLDEPVARLSKRLSALEECSGTAAAGKGSCE